MDVPVFGHQKNCGQAKKSLVVHFSWINKLHKMGAVITFTRKHLVVYAHTSSELKLFTPKAFLYE